MEDFELSLKMFEHALPKYFSGATKLLSAERVQHAMKASQSGKDLYFASLNRAAHSQSAMLLQNSC